MKRGFKKYIKAVFLACIMALAPQLKASSSEPKVLVLVSASDQLRVWRGFQEVWRLYKDLDPEHFTTFFVKGDPDLPGKAIFDFQNDIIWTRSKESVIPGILFKAVIAFEAIESILDEYDYVLWSNVSSFWVFPKLLEQIKNFPRTRCYASHFDEGEGRKWGAGAGYLLSKDVVKEISLLTDYILEGCDEDALRLNDDVYLGDLLLKHFNLDPIQWNRMDFVKGYDDYSLRKYRIPNDVAQIRIRHTDKEERTYSDIMIHKEMLKKYYGIDYIPYGGEVTFPSRYRM